MPASYEHQFRIALHDTDAAGVLFFGHLFRHAHDAYEGLMAAIGWPIDALIRGGDLALPLVHAEADYRRPLRHGDQVRVLIEVAEVAAGRFTLNYRFLDAAGVLVASARTLHCAIEPRSSSACPLPEALAAALGGLAAG